MDSAGLPARRQQNTSVYTTTQLVNWRKIAITVRRDKNGFEFLGYKIKRGRGNFVSPLAVRSQARQGALYAYPKEKSIRRFIDRVRQRTKRKIPLKTKELIAELNPLLRGWGEYYRNTPASERSFTDSMAGL